MNSAGSKAVEKACLARAMVVPRWLPGSNCMFWYKQTLASETWQFVFVDCEKQIRRPVFDHQKLASKIGAEAGEAGKLKLSWLDIDPEGAWVRFQFKDKTWQFSEDGSLEEWHGHFDTGEVEADRDITTPTPKNAKGKTDLLIANRTLEALEYFWINHNGKSDWRIGAIPPQDSVRLASPLGYRFRVVNRSGKTIALEIKKATGVVNIEDTPDGLVLRWEQNALADIDLESSKKQPTKPEYQVFIRRHNIWRRKDGIEKQVSYSGFEDDSFTASNPTPDGRHAVAIQTTPGSQYLLELKNSVPEDQLRPKTQNSANGPNGGHCRAGDHIPTSRPRLFDLAGSREIPVDDSLFRNPYNMRMVRVWAKYRFVFNERGHGHVRLLEIGLDGVVRLLVEEESATVVDYDQKLWYRILPEGNDILWASERDGWNHLYRFSADGTLKNQITQGDWLVRSVEFVDTRQRKIWFKALGVKGQDPYHPHLACVSFDGSALRFITEEDGAHLWQFGPDRRFIIDSWSRVDSLPQAGVIDAATGKQVVFLHKVELGPLESTYVFPERFVAKGRDNETDIYGVIIKPPNFDKNMKYPVIDIIYAHPFQFIVPKSFKNFGALRTMAEAGYVIIMVDGMGTNWRSKAFHDVSYKNIKDAGIPDHIAWIKAAAETRPWMNLERVGIHGSSAGGHSAASAVLHHGSFYKAAVAHAAHHDPRLGSARWEEMYMGWPVDASYAENANGTHARKLTAALMLCTGEMDDVVDPASTMQFADALIKADRDFDLVIVPGDTHYASSDWLAKKEARFFKRYLQDGEPSPNAALPAEPGLEASDKC